MRALRLKTFPDSGCLTHLLGCRTTGEALIVDPKHGHHEAYFHAAGLMGLRIVSALDTHTHADHLSGTASFLEEGVELWLSARSSSARPHRRVEHGETLRVGQLRFTALDVPGHARDSLALSGHGVAVTGDTLLAGGLARTDFPGGDSGRLLDSVRRLLLTLPDNTIVLPGHAYQDVLFSTIGHERRHNPELRTAGSDDRAAPAPWTPPGHLAPEIEATLAANLAAHAPLTEASLPVTCCAPALDSAGGLDPSERTCEELVSSRAFLASSGRWIDVRDTHEYFEEHIPGARSFPLSELGWHLDELKRRGPVVLQCRSGARSMTAARTLRYLGVIQQPINLAGGLLRWKELGLPTEAMTTAGQP